MKHLVSVEAEVACAKDVKKPQNKTRKTVVGTTGRCFFCYRVMYSAYEMQHSESLLN